MRHFICGLMAAAMAIASSPTFGRATIFVPKKSGYAWHTRDLQFLPFDQSDGGITVAAIDDWINKHRGMRAADRTCYMNFVRGDEIVSPDRETDSEIKADLAEFPRSFAERYEPEPGVRFTVRIGVFESCRDSSFSEDPVRYMAVVITDQHGAVRNIDALDWNFIRLFKRDDGKINVFGCFACGEARELLWDKFNDRFYYEWIGH